MKEYLKSLKFKIGLILTCFICMTPVTAYAAITYNTSTPNVTLEHGKEYVFSYTNDTNCSENSAVAKIDGNNIGTTTNTHTSTTTRVQTGTTPISYQGNCSSCYKGSYGTGTSWSCPYCGGKVSRGSAVSGGNPIYGNRTTHTSVSTTTLTADYITMNGKSLVVTMGGKSFTWNITVENPSPKISSNLTLTKSPFFLIYKTFHLCAYLVISQS